MKSKLSIIALLALFVTGFAACGDDHGHDHNDGHNHTDGSAHSDGDGHAHADGEMHEHGLHYHEIGEKPAMGGTLHAFQNGHPQAGMKLDFEAKYEGNEKITAIRTWLAGTDEKAISRVELGHAHGDKHGVHLNLPEDMPSKIWVWFELEAGDKTEKVSFEVQMTHSNE